MSVSWKFRFHVFASLAGSFSVYSALVSSFFGSLCFLCLFCELVKLYFCICTVTTFYLKLYVVFIVDLK